jgi:hypothetical protein
VFVVFGGNIEGFTKCIGHARTYEEALELQRNAVAVGWNRVAIFDAYLKEVKKKPTK